jgi:hypothetical protein
VVTYKNTHDDGRSIHPHKHFDEHMVITSKAAVRTRKYLEMIAQTRAEELLLAEPIHEDHPSYHS